MFTISESSKSWIIQRDRGCFFCSRSNLTAFLKRLFCSGWFNTRLHEGYGSLKLHLALSLPNNQTTLAREYSACPRKSDSPPGPTSCIVLRCVYDRGFFFGRTIGNNQPSTCTTSGQLFSLHLIIRFQRFPLHRELVQQRKLITGYGVWTRWVFPLGFGIFEDDSTIIHDAIVKSASSTGFTFAWKICNQFQTCQSACTRCSKSLLQVSSPSCRVVFLWTIKSERRKRFMLPLKIQVGSLKAEKYRYGLIIESCVFCVVDSFRFSFRTSRFASRPRVARNSMNEIISG